MQKGTNFDLCYDESLKVKKLLKQRLMANILKVQESLTKLLCFVGQNTCPKLEVGPLYLYCCINSPLLLFIHMGRPRAPTQVVEIG